MEKSLQNQLMLIILLIVTLFTSRVVPHSTEKREIQEIQSWTLQSSLFGPILVTCLMTFDVFILFGGILLTKSTLKHQSENADFFDKSQSHQNEKMTTIVPMIPAANTRRKNYYMGGQNREYNNDDYKIEVNKNYIETYEYIEEYVERNEKFTLPNPNRPNPNRNRLIQIQNESILRNNSTSTTNSTIKTKNPISQIKNSSSNMGSRSASPNFVQFPAVSRIKSSNMSSRSNSTSPSPSFVQFPPPARTKSSISSQKTNSSSSNMSLQSTSSSLILPSSTARIEHKPNYSYI